MTPTDHEINLHADNLDALMVHATAVVCQQQTDLSNKAIRQVAVIAAVRAYRQKLEENKDATFLRNGLIVSNSWAKLNAA